MTTEISDFLNSNYSSLLSYASRIIKATKVELDPSEVVNNVVIWLIDKRCERAEELYRQAEQGVNLDRYMKCIIKSEITMPKSSTRYKRGGRYTSDIESVEYMLLTNDIDSGVGDADTRLYEALESVGVSETDLDIFLWRLDGRPYAEHPSGRCKSSLSRIYARVKKKILPLLTETL